MDIRTKMLARSCNRRGGVSALPVNNEKGRRGTPAVDADGKRKRAGLISNEPKCSLPDFMCQRRDANTSRFMCTHTDAQIEAVRTSTMWARLKEREEKICQAMHDAMINKVMETLNKQN